MELMSDDVIGIEQMELTNEVPLEVTPLVKKKRARTGNYTAAEDEALVLAWENVPIAQGLCKQKDKKHHRPFLMLQCWQLLKDNEKWRARPTDPSQKKLKSCNSSSPDIEEEEEEEDSADEEGERRRSPTPSSRPPGSEEEKDRVKKQAQGTMYKEVLEKMMHNKVDLEAEKKRDKEEKWKELKAIEERKVAIEEERLQIKKGRNKGYKRSRIKR
ncbi:hypothetical protein HU200_003024 [Digitaria exilis]|uniref:No apical meristem-associated C-terminal domain-containing protein n=1 Tax=Digitaria exilis TaxID=1010633 RepID=A0A835FUQ3_9POAL|nr:hypothetical protein HU200_003024 [Digitaria exilis]